MKKQIRNNIPFTRGAALSAFFLLLGIGTAHAQVQNNGIFYVGTYGTFFVQSGTMTFGASSATSTTKTAPYAATDGKIMLGSSASFNTDGTTGKFVNGYAGTFNTAETTLAIGDGTVYAPIKVTAATNTIGLNAAYFNTAPSTAYTGGLDASVTAVANTEYWIAKGENAVLSLSWRAGSNLSTYIPASLSGLTIVGYRTSTSKWEAIDAAPEAGATLTAGYIKATTAITLSNYSAFAIGLKGVDCPTTIFVVGTAKTWNGSSWTGGTPTLADPAVLGANYAGGSFVCNSLALSSFTVTLSGTETLEVVNEVTGGIAGKIIMSSESSFVQRNAASAAPTIELTKTTRAIKRFDYVYWGQPITSNAFGQLAGAVSGISPTGAFDAKYKYVSGVLDATGGWQNLTATTSGQGFIMRVKDQAPFTTASTTATIDLKFTGTANNGDVTASVFKVTGNDTSARNNNLLANPYPSAIDAEKFLIQNNTLVDGVIYLWRATTANTGAAGAAYTAGDYIAYTKAGNTYTNGATTGFDGKIASGQGFKVRALASGTARFTNCMRVAGSNSQFLRTNAYATSTSTDAPKNRFKLNLQTESGIANQIVVAYLPETTLAYDNMYDARLLSTSGTTIFSVLDNDTQKLAINARPAFENTDQVTLGFFKDAAVTTPMSINLADKEGIFANNQTPVYLFDTLLNTYHNFANGAYSFATTATEDTNRFKVVYQTSALGNQDFTTAAVTTYIKYKKFNLTSSKEVASVQIFDLTGRVVAVFQANNQKTVVEDFNYATAVYLAKITFTDGSLASQKLINN